MSALSEHKDKIKQCDFPSFSRSSVQINSTKFCFIIIFNQSIMPFLFRVQVRDSEIEGKGLFALQDIPQGADFWVFQQENPLPVIGHLVEKNSAYSRQQMQAKTHEELETIFKGGLYIQLNDVFTEFRDGTQFTNHSHDANTITIYPTKDNYKELKIVTTKPIKLGDEIFENYYVHESRYYAEWVTALIGRHYPDRLRFSAELCQQARLLQGKV